MIKKFLTLIFVLGIICVIVIGSFLSYQKYNDSKINSDALKFLDEFDSKILEEDNIQVIQEDIIVEKELNTITEAKQDDFGYSYKGYSVSGKIDIPKIGIKYPILAEMTDSRALDVSICIQYFSKGATLNGIGNTVIIGHNYRDGLFFGENDKLEINDSVFITDTNTGSKIEYKIYEKFYTIEDDTSFYDRNTDGKKEVTLVTCKRNDNSYRLILKAREV